MKIHPHAKFVASSILFPASLYFALFCLLTYPLMARFSTRLFGDEGDGLQVVWNIWWVNRAITVLHQSPWHTDYLRYPYGSTLLCHTLTAFNGFLSIPLLPFLDLIRCYNVALIFTFVAGGVTAFLLAHYLTRSYWPSLVAGFIFTFANYHFAHAEGHLNLSSIEWIPLFILSWYALMLRPRVATAVGAAFVLFLVLLCEYNFFLYCVLAGIVVFCWNALRLGDVAFFLRKAHALPIATFVLATLATSGSLVIPLMVMNFRDPLVGGHEPRDFSMDLLAPLIPGGHWRFASLTRPYWSRLLGGNIEENSVHLGLAVIVLLIYGCHARKRVELDAMGLWYFLLSFFAVLGLGPQLQVYGSRFTRTDGLLPYAWLETLIPPLKVSGVPVRMAIMMTLFAAVISAGALRVLWGGGLKGRILALSLLAVLAVEYLPRPLPATDLRIPGYVEVLKDLPGGVGVWDAAVSSPKSMFHQTIHKKPIAFGYLPRVPMSVHDRDRALADALRDRRFDVIWRRYHIRYLTVGDEPIRYLLLPEVPRDFADSPGLKLVYRDGVVRLFDLAPGADSPSTGVEGGASPTSWPGDPPRHQ